MKIRIDDSQLHLLSEQYYYDNNDVRRTIPKNQGMTQDDTTLQASKRHNGTDKEYEPSSEDQEKINKVRSKLIFYFDKTLDKIVQLEKDIMKEKYSNGLNPRFKEGSTSDRVEFSEKKLIDLKGSLDNVKEMLKDEVKLLELYDEGVFSVKKYTPINYNSKGGDPDTEPSRLGLRKHMLGLRKKIEDLGNKEDKSPEEMDLLKKYKEEYDNEFDSSMLY